jgi:hypothetical protein
MLAVEGVAEPDRQQAEVAARTVEHIVAERQQPAHRAAADFAGNILERAAVGADRQLHARTVVLVLHDGEPGRVRTQHQRLAAADQHIHAAVVLADRRDVDLRTELFQCQVASVQQIGCSAELPAAVIWPLRSAIWPASVLMVPAASPSLLLISVLMPLELAVQSAAGVRTRFSPSISNWLRCAVEVGSRPTASTWLKKRCTAVLTPVSGLPSTVLMRAAKSLKASARCSSEVAVRRLSVRN